MAMAGTCHPVKAKAQQAATRCLELFDSVEHNEDIHHRKTWQVLSKNSLHRPAVERIASEICKGNLKNLSSAQKVALAISQMTFWEALCKVLREAGADDRHNG